ncbi:ABC transporter substrate-binding protein [Haloferacaceae archaeon DSL9]
MRANGSIDGALTRRRLVAGLAAAGLASVAGCIGGGDGDGGDEDENRLRVSGWPADDIEADTVQAIVDDYNAENEDVEVEYNAVQSEYEQTLRTRLGAGDAPDVFYVDASYFGSFASEDVLLDLSELEDDADFDIDDIFDPLLDAFRFDGTLYGIPKDFSTLSLYYNETMLDEAGVEVPETWDEWRDALVALDESLDIDAPMVEFPNGRMFWSLLHQNGGDVLSEDGSELLLDSEECIEALEFMTGLRDDELLSTPDEIGTDWHGETLATERAAMAVIGPWALPYLRDNAPEVDENIGVSHLPIPEGGERATAAYTVSYSAAYDTANPEAAKDLIATLTGDDGMQRWATEGIALSARESHGELDFYGENPRYRTHLEAGEWSHPVAFGPQSEAILNRIEPQLEAAMLDEATAREALERGTDQVNNDVLN